MNIDEQLLQFMLANPILLIILIVWTLTLKGISMWMAARRDQRNWFVALLIFNTLGILEIFYILYTKYKEKNENSNQEKLEIFE